MSEWLQQCAVTRPLSELDAQIHREPDTQMHLHKLSAAACNLLQVKKVEFDSVPEVDYEPVCFDLAKPVERDTTSGDEQWATTFIEAISLHEFSTIYKPLLKAVESFFGDKEKTSTDLVKASLKQNEADLLNAQLEHAAALTELLVAVARLGHIAKRDAAKKKKEKEEVGFAQNLFSEESMPLGKQLVDAVTNGLLVKKGKDGGPAAAQILHALLKAQERKDDGARLAAADTLASLVARLVNAGLDLLEVLLKDEANFLQNAFLRDLKTFERSKNPLLEGLHGRTKNPLLEGLHSRIKSSCIKENDEDSIVAELLELAAHERIGPAVVRCIMRVGGHHYHMVESLRGLCVVNAPHVRKALNAARQIRPAYYRLTTSVLLESSFGTSKDEGESAELKELQNALLDLVNALMHEGEPSATCQKVYSQFMLPRLTFNLLEQNVDKDILMEDQQITNDLQKAFLAALEFVRLVSLHRCEQLHEQIFNELETLLARDTLTSLPIAEGLARLLQVTKRQGKARGVKY